MKLEIEINGDTESDLTMALDEVKKLVEQGYISGKNGNETGDYRFTVEGEEKKTDDAIELSDGGWMELDREDGRIRRYDKDGNCEDFYDPGDERWHEWINSFDVEDEDYGKMLAKNF